MTKIELMRPPIDPQKMLLKCALTIACFGIGFFLIITSIYLCQDYRLREARSITLSAVVSSVKRDSNDDSISYDVYVSYEYEGIQYTAHYEESSDKEWYDRIGEKVEIVVDSENPDTQIKDLVHSLFFSFFFGMPIFALGFYTVGMRGRKTYVEEYGNTGIAIEADKIMTERRKIWWLPLLIYSAGEIAWGISIADIDGIYAGAILLGCMAIPFGVVLLTNYIIKQVKLR